MQPDCHLPRVNLISAEQVRWNIVKLLMYRWSRFWAIGFCIMLVFWLQQYLMLKECSLIADRWEQQSRPVRLMEASLDEGSQQIRKLRQELLSYEDLERPAARVLCVSQVLRQLLMQSEVDVAVHRVSFGGDHEQSARAENASRDVSVSNEALLTSIRIEGHSPTVQDASHVATKLVSMELFSTVRLISLETVAGSTSSEAGNASGPAPGE